MADKFDPIFGIQAVALPLREARSRILAANLANADTPNYKAQDIDFKAALLKVRGDDHEMRSPPLKITHRNHIAGVDESITTSAYLRYRMPTQPSLDGNTVETHIEKAKFMENGIAQSATLEFLNDRIKSIRNALRGE